MVTEMQMFWCGNGCCGKCTNKTNTKLPFTLRFSKRIFYIILYYIYMHYNDIFPCQFYCCTVYDILFHFSLYPDWSSVQSSIYLSLYQWLWRIMCVTAGDVHRQTQYRPDTNIPAVLMAWLDACLLFYDILS